MAKNTPHQSSASILIEEVRKNKKNEPKVFPFLLMVDREAFGRLDEQTFILKTFWQSPANKIIVARKSDSKSIVGYACYQENKEGCYLMRIGVRSKCQRQGIGRKLMSYLFSKYPNHLSLDISTDNEKAVKFYKRIGLSVVETYLSEEKVEFNKFETPSGFVYEPLFEDKKEEIKKPYQSDDEETQISESTSEHFTSAKKYLKSESLYMEEFNIDLTKDEEVTGTA